MCTISSDHADVLPGSPGVRAQTRVSECSRSRARLCWCSRPGGETGESEGHSGGALVPKGHGLDAGKDFPLVSRQSHSHVEKIPETNRK